MSFTRIFLLSIAVLMCIGTLSSCGASEEQSSEAVSNESSEAVSEEESSEPEEVYPEYWGHTEYDRTENIGAPEEITSYQTKITRRPTASAWGYVSEYMFEYNTDAGKVYMTFHETKWGTYNIGMWYLIDSNGKKHQMVEGYTDFEYVHIANGVWSGGNHGNEALISIDLYNGETGEKIELKNGESVVVNVLHIIEKTKLLSLPNPTSVREDISGWTENDVYAEVTRKYTVTGPQVKLNVDYLFVKDTRMNRSYNCMFPVSKQYGLTCEMYDAEGNLLTTIETPKENSNFNGNHNSGNKATRAVIYGYEKPEYRFHVYINTVADSADGFKGDYKTAFWDMSTSNKLYFTKFSNGSITTVKEGTEFHTECVWVFEYVAE